MSEDRIRIEYMPLSSLAKRKRNPKDHDIGVLHQSFNRFGMVNPFIIDEANGELVAGHGRLDTLMQKKKAGEAPPARVVVKGKEWLVPVVRGVSFASYREAEAYLLADNRTCELGGWNAKELTDLLSEFAKDGEDMLAGIGFDMNDLSNLMAKNSLSQDGAGKAPSEKVCPACGHRF